MSFQIRHEKCGEFSPNHSKIRKFHFDGLFLSKVFEVWAQKNTKELSFMTLNSDAKFESTLTFWFPKWHSELGDLSLEHQEVWKLYIDGFFLSKAYNVSVRKFQRSYVSWHWRVLQGKLTCGLKNGIMNLVNFHASSRKSKICTLIRSFCPKHIKI